MYKDKTFLAIIPARGKSKRLPRKNILPLAGKPLVVWSIEAALKSKYLDKVILSTDDIEIIGVCKKTGIEIPFVRPDELSTDTATSVEVVKHAIEHCQTHQKMEFNYIMLLQPTSPLRTSKDIDDAIESLLFKKADAIISVCEADHIPIWMNYLPDDLCMDNFLSQEDKNRNTQSYRKYYRLNGAMYLCDRQRLLQEESLFLKSNTFAFIMPRERSIDIDTQFDLQFAEFLIHQKNMETKQDEPACQPD